MATRNDIINKFKNGMIPPQEDFQEIFDSYVHKVQDKADFAMVEAGTNNETYITPALLNAGLQNLGVITGNCYMPFKEYFEDLTTPTTLLLLQRLPIEASVKLFKNGQLLREGEDYTINYITAAITFSDPVIDENIEVDYWFKNTGSAPGGTDITQYLPLTGGTLTGDLIINTKLNNGFSNDASGTYSHAEGNLTTASGSYSHSEGRETIASQEGAHAEGFQTKAAGKYSNTQGNKSVSNGNYSHAEGANTIAGGEGSHAEGFGGTYSLNPDGSANTDLRKGPGGKYSHTEGRETSTSATGPTTTYRGDYAHAEGFRTQANANYAHAEGKDNIVKSPYAHAEGESNTIELSNPYTGVSNTGNGSHAEGYQNICYEDYSHAEGSDNKTYGEACHAEGYKTEAYGLSSHTEGKSTKVYSQYGHAEGEDTTVGVSGNHSTGESGHAEGKSTNVQGNWAHAEGYHTQANQQASHAEGNYTITNGFASHAEGSYTTANGNYSHASGQNTIANGEGSAALGTGTITHSLGKGQVALGNYNTVINSALLVIGNGVSDSNRSNLAEFYSGYINYNKNLFLPATTIAQIDAASNKAVVTKEWVQAQTLPYKVYLATLVIYGGTCDVERVFENTTGVTPSFSIGSNTTTILFSGVTGHYWGQYTVSNNPSDGTSTRITGKENSFRIYDPSGASMNWSPTGGARYISVELRIYP